MPPAPQVDGDAKTALFSAPSYGAADARPLIGQEGALEGVRQAIASAFAQHRTRLVALDGVGGSGKTRLLVASSELAAKNYNKVRVLYAACRTQDDGVYAPFSRLLLDRFGITPASAPTKVRSLMAAEVAEALGKRDAGKIAETTHLLGNMAGVRFPGSPFLHGLKDRHEELQARSAQALTRMLSGDARGRPLLILLDDMGQAEKEAWTILDTLLGADAPIAIVATGQDPLAERTAALKHSDAAVVLPIKPLAKDGIRDFARSMVPGLDEAPDTFVDALLHRSHGNPGALAEIVRAAGDRGLFQQTEEGVELDEDKLGGGEFPVNLDDAIRGRIAALEPDEREVMERASVVGERFWDGLLLALQRAEGPKPGQDLEPLAVWSDVRDEMGLSATLQRLEARELIERVNETESTGLQEYTFAHAATRGLLYDDLAEDTRVSRHAVVARWLSTVSDDLDGGAGLIAPHLEHAGQTDRAAHAYLRAAVDERARVRTRAALRMVEKALPLIEDENVDTRMEAAHEHGSLLTILGRYDEAHDAFHGMLRLAWELGARGRGGAALNRIARIHRQRGEHQKALDNFKGALLMFRAADDQRGVASTYDDLAQIHRWRGHTDPALSAAKEALEIRIAIKDKRGQAVSLNTIGYIELDRGRFDNAEARFNTALRIRKEIDDHEGEVQTHIALGRLAYQLGQNVRAVEIYGEGLDGARAMENHRFQSYLLNGLGEAYLADGQHVQARAAFTEAKQLATAMRDQRVLADIQRNLGLLALAQGDATAGLKLQEALSMAREYGTREAIAMAHRSMGRLQARTLFGTDADPNAAEQSLRECIQMFGECGAVHEVARSQVELGFHLIERGDAGGGGELLREAHATLHRLRLPEAARVEATLADL